MYSPRYELFSLRNRTEQNTTQHNFINNYTSQAERRWRKRKLALLWKRESAGRQATDVYADDSGWNRMM